ncbi:MAG TPA: glycosyltransferase [Candidatus Krumholzibacteria bacterium]
MRVALITPDRLYHPFVAMIVEGLRARGDEFFGSDPGNGLKPEEVLDYDPGWFTAAEQAQAVLVFFGKEGSLAAGEPPSRAPKYHLLDGLDDNEPRAVTAYLDYSEMTATGRENPGQIEAMKSDPRLRRGEPWFNHWVLENCAHYFKRELFPDDPQGVKKIGYTTGGYHTSIWPIAFGMLADYRVPVPRQGKDWDLFCCFGHTATGLRKEVVEECRRLQGTERGRKIVVKERLSARDYRQCLARSKIVVDAWGHGDHCYRLWEAAGAEACVLYQRYQVRTGPDWFQEGQEIVGYSTAKEFRHKAESLLALPEAAMTIGRRGLRKALAHHTGKARVNYIMKTMGLE